MEVRAHEHSVAHYRAGVLIAEKLLLVAVNDQGRLPTGKTSLMEVGLTAAFLAELAIDGQLGLVEHGRLRAATIQRGETRPIDPLLADVYDALQGHLANRDARTLIQFLGGRIGGSWDRVVDRLIDTGVLGRNRPSPLLPTQHPVINVAAYQAVMAEVQTAALGPGPVRPDTAVILRLVKGPQYYRVLPPRGPARVQAMRNTVNVMARTTLPPDVANMIDELVSAANWRFNQLNTHHGG
jgi:Golgi phosphoprotein 3 (GPP34)